MEQVTDQISLGELKAGDQLPTVRELAQELDVNFNTVARAYRILDQASIISTQHGRGSYILPPEILIATEKSVDLDRLVKEFLQHLVSEGYTTAEILAVFQRNLRHMKDE